MSNLMAIITLKHLQSPIKKCLKFYGFDKLSYARSVLVLCND